MASIHTRIFTFQLMSTSNKQRSRGQTNNAVELLAVVRAPQIFTFGRVAIFFSIPTLVSSTNRQQCA